MNSKNRIGVIMGVAFVIGFLIMAKLLYVQVFANEAYSSMSLSNRLQEVSIMPDRGLIYDCKGEALAISVKRKSVYITPSEIRKLKNKEKVINTLAETLAIPKRDVETAVNTKDSDFRWLKRHADTAAVKKLEKEDFRGVGFTDENKREYPKERLASQVLGFAGIDNQGLSGVELQFNDVLAGNPGKLLVEYDGKGNIIPQSIRESTPATAGDDVYLTIDGTIQYIVERQLAKAAKQYEPQQITCIVQEVDTGNILAMASLPDFDPNNYGKSDKNTWKNAAISKVYEPGSVFKVVSASMFLDDDVATPQSQYYCPGSIMIDGHELRCWTYPDGQGPMTLRSGVAMSCNIVMAKSVARLGKERFYDYLHGFGFTRKTNIDLPAESDPVLVPKDQAVSLDLAAMAIGQANAYTPIQMIDAISAIANGGTLMKPQIVDKITDRKGKTVRQNKPEEVRRILSKERAEQVQEMMEAVVTEGIGKEGAVPGYRVAGKTGTAEIAREGRYAKGDYIMSFGGFAPAGDPKISCIVIVNSPRTNASSGTVAGPVFSAIVKDVMRYYEIPSSLPDKSIEEPSTGHLTKMPKVSYPIDVNSFQAVIQKAGLTVDFVGEGSQVVSALPLAGAQVSGGDKVRAYLSEPDAKEVTLPDFSGMTLKEVDHILSGFGLQAALEGSGLAWYQTPAAGSRVNVGSSVSVQFASTSEQSEIRDVEEEKAAKAKKKAAQAAAKAKAKQTSTGSPPNP